MPQILIRKSDGPDFVMGAGRIVTTAIVKQIKTMFAQNKWFDFAQPHFARKKLNIELENIVFTLFLFQNILYAM